MTKFSYRWGPTILYVCITDVEPRNELAAYSLDRVLRVSKACRRAYVDHDFNALHSKEPAFIEELEQGMSVVLYLEKPSLESRHGYGTEKVIYILTPVYGSQM